MDRFGGFALRLQAIVEAPQRPDVVRVLAGAGQTGRKSKVLPEHFLCKGGCDHGSIHHGQRKRGLEDLSFNSGLDDAR